MRTVYTFFILLIVGTSLSAQVKSTKLIKGVWQNDGYGRIIEITDRFASIYDICSVDCNRSEKVPAKMLFKMFQISKESDSVLLIQNGMTKYYLNKLANLPELCLKKVADKKDPTYNFETLWHTFNENFCYFKERKVDWSALKSKYQSRIGASTTSYELFMIMDSLLTELDDGHSTMFVPNSLESQYEAYEKAQREIRTQAMLDTLGQDFKRFPINVDEVRLKTIGNYVDDVKSYNFGLLNYGLVNDQVAYVQINGMDGFANYNIAKNTDRSKALKIYQKNSNRSKDYLKENVAGTAFIMDKIISEIKNTKACIIDIRFNGGGFDEVQLEILKRLATKENLIFTKMARVGAGYSRKQEVHIKPAENAYKGKVYILTSHQTASAAEGFVLGTMAAIPNSIRIGSNTTGIFSDMLGKKLPNGWEYSLSNEIYESYQGMNYEAVGIPPHHAVRYDKRTYWFYREFYDNETGKDQAVERALQLIDN